MKATSELQQIKINDRKDPYRWIKVQHYLGQKMICEFALSDLHFWQFLNRYITFVSPSRNGHLNFMFFDSRIQPYKNLHVRISSCHDYLQTLVEKRLCQ